MWGKRECFNFMEASCKTSLVWRLLSWNLTFLTSLKINDWTSAGWKQNPRESSLAPWKGMSLASKMSPRAKPWLISESMTACVFLENKSTIDIVKNRIAFFISSRSRCYNIHIWESILVSTDMQKIVYFYFQDTSIRISSHWHPWKWGVGVLQQTDNDKNAHKSKEKLLPLFKIISPR